MLQLPPTIHACLSTVCLYNIFQRRMSKLCMSSSKSDHSLWTLVPTATPGLLVVGSLKASRSHRPKEALNASRISPVDGVRPMESPFHTEPTRPDTQLMDCGEKQVMAKVAIDTPRDPLSKAFIRGCSF